MAAGFQYFCPTEVFPWKKNLNSICKCLRGHTSVMTTTTALVRAQICQEIRNKPLFFRRNRDLRTPASLDVAHKSRSSTTALPKLCRRRRRFVWKHTCRGSNINFKKKKKTSREHCYLYKWKILKLNLFRCRRSLVCPSLLLWHVENRHHRWVRGGGSENAGNTAIEHGGETKLNKTQNTHTLDGKGHRAWALLEWKKAKERPHWKITKIDWIYIFTHPRVRQYFWNNGRTFSSSDSIEFYSGRDRVESSREHNVERLWLFRKDHTYTYFINMCKNDF